MSNRILCKFFMHGACKKGDACAFSHDWKDQPSTVCTFYQRGVCTYGNRCRYDHVKAAKQPGEQDFSSEMELLTLEERADQLTSTSYKNRSVSQPYVLQYGTGSYSQVLDSNLDLQPSDSNLNEDWNLEYLRDFPEEEEPEKTNHFSSGPFHDYKGSGQLYYPYNSSYAPDELLSHTASQAPAWQSHVSATSANGSGSLGGMYNFQEASFLKKREAPLKLEDRPLCQMFSKAGECPSGASCSFVHGNLCETCGKYSLHPHRPEDVEDHRRQCERGVKLIQRLRQSQEVECCVCLEKVLGKMRPSERRFGVLSHCDHPFCIACIRGWRGGAHSLPQMDLHSTIRACPVCRVQSHFVTPSVLWYFSKEEKEEIVSGYKKRLSEIDCRHFDFGEGTCPFGTSCFYKHAYRDGTVEVVKLRHLGAADGSTVIVKDIRLSDFLKPVLGKR